jgi:hypothetical protein
VNIDKVASHTELRDLPRSIGLEVQQRVAARSSTLDVALEYLEPGNSKSELMSLSGTAIYYQHSLVCVLVPRENLGSRVDKCGTTKIVVANMNLRIATIQGQRSTIRLRHSDISESRCRNLKLVASRVERVVL